MQTQGSLQESSLASLLQAMQAERATGTLSIDSGSDNASLYFLFGHLFHASGTGGQGEDVVLGALGWADGNFKFDPRAKLPAEETIKSSPAELIAEAERRSPAPAQANGSEAWGGAAATEATPAEAAYVPETPAAPEAAEAPAEAPAEPATEVASWATPAETPAEPAYTEPAAYTEAAPAPPAYTQPQPEYAAPEPAATWATPAEAEPAPAAAPEASPSWVTAPAPAAPVETTSTAMTSVLGAPTAPQLDIFYPLPAGRAQYEGLKSAFVDFPKLLRTLRGDQHTGYVRLNAVDFNGVLLFNEGHLLQALTTDAAGKTGEQAFMTFRRRMDAGDGSLDVIELSAEIVTALAQLITAPLLYTGLLGRFVNFASLLEHLQEDAVDGAVLVLNDDDIGIILLRQGNVLGSYTKSDPKLATAPTDVTKIAGEKNARIEVKSGSGTVTALDIEAALNRPY